MKSPQQRLDYRQVLCISGRITGQEVRMLRIVLGQEAGALSIDLKEKRDGERSC